MKTDRYNNIIKNEKYRAIVEDIEELESDRIFCHHDMGHFLDVARIAVLINNDEDYGIDRDIIYAAALLHDIGRAAQYRTGIRHEKESAELSRPILEECGYSEDEICRITKAIYDHSDESVISGRDLSSLLYRADKMSRKCFMCKAIDKCHKPREKLVMEIKY